MLKLSNNIFLSLFLCITSIFFIGCSSKVASVADIQDFQKNKMIEDPDSLVLIEEENLAIYVEKRLDEIDELKRLTINNNGEYFSKVKKKVVIKNSEKYMLRILRKVMK